MNKSFAIATSEPETSGLNFINENYNSQFSTSLNYNTLISCADIDPLVMQSSTYSYGFPSFLSHLSNYQAAAAAAAAVAGVKCNNSSKSILNSSISSFDAMLIC